VRILQIQKHLFFYSILSLCTFLWVQSCKKTQPTPASQPQVNRGLDSIEEIPKQELPISTITGPKEFSDWPHYPVLDTAIKNLKNGDPSFFKQPIEDLNQLFLDIKKSVPKPLKTNSILVRVKVTETLARKLHELYSVENTDVTEIEQTKANLIESHANLIFQINKTREKEAQRIVKPI
jgi:hypothetical protein